MWTANFHRFKLDLEKTEMRDQNGNMSWIIEKARKTSISALLKSL